MNFSSESIYILRTIAEMGSFSDAAKALHRVPSAVSYMVKKMEEELGICLFDRNGKYIQPTAATEYIISHGAWVLQGMEDLKRHAIQLSTGIDPSFTIALNYIVNATPVTNLLNHLCEQFPTTELAVRTEVYNGCWDALYEGRADLVIGAPQNPPWYDDISTEPLGEIDWSFVVANTHPLAQVEDLLYAETLRLYPSVVVHDSSVALQPQKTWALRGQKMIYAADLKMAKSLIASGIGVGFLPSRFICDAVENGTLVVKKIADHKQPIAVYYAWRTHYHSPVLTFLLNELRLDEYKRAWLV